MLNVKTLPLHNVLLGCDVRDAQALFDLVAEHIAAGQARVATRIRSRLARRHDRSSVDLANGFALPHAAVPGLTTARFVYVRSQKPIVMGLAAKKGVTDSLTLLIPSPGLAAEYQLLMMLTQALQTAAAARALRKARSASEIQAWLTSSLLGPDARNVHLQGSVSADGVWASASSR